MASLPDAVVVVGATGFVGRNLVARLANFVPEVVAVSPSGRIVVGAPRADRAQIGGAWRAALAAPARPRLLPLPHPSWRNTGWLRAHPWFEAECLPALRDEVRRVLDASPR